MENLCLIRGPGSSPPGATGARVWSKGNRASAPPAAMAEHVKLEGHNQEYYAAVRQSETGLYAVTWRECQDRWWSEKKGVCGTVLAVRGLSVRQRRTGLLACDCVRTGVAEL